MVGSIGGGNGNGNARFPQIVTFDYGSLNAIYSIGAKLGSSQHAEILRNGPLKELLRRVDAGVSPPWEFPEPTPTLDELFNRVFSTGKLIDPKDPLFDRDDVNDEFKSLFALYKGLTRIQELTEFSSTDPRAETYRKLLDKQFKAHRTEIEGFVKGIDFQKITLLSGLRQVSTSSSLQFPASNTVARHFGPSVVSVRTDPVPGVTATDTFDIKVNKADGTTQTVTVNLANVVGALNLDNIVAEINTQLATVTGAATRFAVERYNETQYGTRIDFGSGETVEMTAAAATEAKAVYLSGTAGSGAPGAAFVTKYDGLDAAGPTQVFYRNINSLDGADAANGTTVDSKGNVYVVGTTGGSLDSQINSTDTRDVFLQKYDAAGKLIYTQLLGSAKDASGFAVAVDSSDNVLIAGQAAGPLTSTATGANLDRFVTKFDSTGVELWTYQAGVFADDAALGLTVDSSNNVYLSGITRGEFAGETAGGGGDAFVTRLDSAGALVYNEQFGDGGEEIATSVTVDSSGNVYVVGTDDGDGFLRKYSGTTPTQTYSHNLGTVGAAGGVTGVALDSAGDVIVSGYTTNATLFGTVVNAHSGGTDAFILKIDDQGATAATTYVTYVGTTGEDRGFSVKVDTATDAAYIAGNTSGTFSGQTKVGNQDGFLAKVATAGSVTYARQFGGTFDHTAAGIAFDANGTNVVTRLGLGNGKIPQDKSEAIAVRTSARAEQFFYMSVDGGSKRKITLDNDDTFTSIATQINGLFGAKVSATFKDDTGQRALKIKALDGAKIEIFKGNAGFDALAGLGLKEGALHGDPTDESEAEAASESLFELGILSTLNLLNAKNAEDANIVLNNALRVVREAFRFMTEGPRPPLEDPIGPPPAFLAKQLAGLQAALNKVQAFGTPQFNPRGGLFSLLA